MKYKNLSNIFDNDSDSDVDIKTNKEYAKNYDVWRKKEELNKLKTKYGEGIEDDQDTSSSSEDDEEGIEITNQIEKDFFKTLACLKNKDPRIYDESVQFFQNKDEDKTSPRKDKKKNKEKPMYLKDYERNIILEKGGVLSDDEDEEDNRVRSPTYIEEQARIKESLKSALNAVKDEEEGDDWGGLFKERKKTKDEKENEEVDYKKWLSGQEKIDDKEVESELKPLKEYWNKPDLEEGEKFLRDYILKDKFLDKDEEGYIPTYDEVIHDSDEDLSVDEEMIEKQEEFEHKYNFRFEDPDQDFIKRYPRTIESSVRRKDDKRKLKRMETAERKKKEKDEKRKDLKKLQDLKRKEIEEKLEKLREITGNTDLGFADEDVDGDFDPDAHDKRMQALFNDEFYEGPEDDQKPEFPDLDKELEIENWERYQGETEEVQESAPHCEDDGFIMDCDYDPQASTQKELIERSRGKKKRKRKSKFAEAVSKPKPTFDPNDRNYEKYFEEYYKLDCEDFIGDIPCRFKYRKVVPNDFGLSMEEILLAKERELNKWCSLKKAVQIRPDHVEKYDQIAYKRKSENINLKQKILPSLFKTSENNEDGDGETEPNTSNSRGRAKGEQQFEEVGDDSKGAQVNNPEKSHGDNDKEKSTLNDERQAGHKKKMKKKNQKKKSKNVDGETVSNRQINPDSTNMDSTGDEHSVKRKLKKKKAKNVNNDQNGKSKNRKRANSETQSGAPKKKFKKMKSQSDTSKELSMPDARLAAYGINPKKYKNKLKYGSK